MENEKAHILFPDLSPDERAIAQENLDRYLELVWEIWEELQEKNSPD